MLVSDEGRAGDFFGTSVALDGDTALVGAWGSDAVADGAGAAFVFIRDGDRWNLTTSLVASDGAAQDGFGRAVALWGDTAVVGAPFRDDHGLDTGVVYVFRREGGAWRESAILSGSDARRDDWFGSSLSLSADDLLVGTPMAGERAGAAYVFEDRAGRFVETHILVPPLGTSGEFGWSVALDGHVALVTTSDRRSGSGTAEVFERVGDVWRHVDTLTSPLPERPDDFGIAAAASGHRALVGARHDSTLGVSNAGMAHVFERSDEGWWHAEALHAPRPRASEYFGVAVALDGDAAVVGALEGPSGGAAYVFRRLASGDWSVEAELTSSSATAFGLFGGAVAISGPNLIVGANYEEPAGDDSGAAHVYFVHDLCGNGIVEDAEECDLLEQPNCCSRSCAILDSAAVCRVANGACDVEERCLGIDVDCPDDAWSGADTICRVAVDRCDAQEVCTGASPLCPLDSALECRDGNVCTSDECDARSGCVFRDVCADDSQLDASAGDAARADDGGRIDDGAVDATSHAAVAPPGTCACALAAREEPTTWPYGLSLLTLALRRRRPRAAIRVGSAAFAED